MTLFSCPTFPPCAPEVFAEDPWSVDEIRIVVRRLKCNKAADRADLVAELLKHAPDEVLAQKKHHFDMLSKSAKTKFVSNLRRIANIWLMHQVFAYLPCLEKHHGVRWSFHHFEQNPPGLHANIAGPISCVSISYAPPRPAKAQAKVHDQMLWKKINTDDPNFGTSWANVLSTTIFAVTRCSSMRRPALKFNLQAKFTSRIRAQSPHVPCNLTVGHRGAESKCMCCLDFQDGLPRLLDLRFADDILVFAKTAVERTWGLVRDLVRARAYRAPPAVRRAAMFGWARRWWNILPVAVQQAVAGTALGFAWPAASPTCAADATPVERVLDCPSAWEPAGVGSWAS